MSYLNHHSSLRERAASGVAVIALQAGIGVALVTGLTISTLAPEPETRVIGINVKPEALPPEPAPAPSAAAPMQTPMAPLPAIPLSPPLPGPIFDPVQPAEPAVTYIPSPVPAPSFTPGPLPQPSPSFAPKRPVPLGNPGGWISTDDYPSAPLRLGIEGAVRYRLVVSSDGKVTACELIQSSGNAQLDQATCRYLSRRARFAPAADPAGTAIVGTYLGTVQWEIPD